MPFLALRCLFLLLACVWTSSLLAWGSLPVLQPTDYRSPSGEYHWRVDPTERSGAGPASYTLLRSAVPVFSGTLDLTLRDAAVSDDGALLGVAYSEGNYRDGGDFVVAIVDTTGAMRELAREPRESSRYLHTPANPLGRGVVIDGVGERAYVRIEDADVNRASESWWIFALPDGTPISRIQPRESQPDNAALRRIWSVRPLPGTPLLLVQWAKTSTGPATDIRFALLDGDFKAVWTLDRPDEYRDRRLAQRVAERGAVLDTGPGRFVLWLGAKGERVEYKVSRSDVSGAVWNVAETGRSRQARLESAPAKPAAIAARILPSLGSFELDAGAPRAPAPFEDFAIDDRGRFGLLRCACGAQPTFQLLQPDGVLQREIALDFRNKGADDLAVAWIDKDRWLLVASDRQRAFGYWLDAETSNVQPLPEFRAPPIEQLARDGIGGFVALTSLHGESTIEQSVRAFDANGRERWVIGQRYGSDEHLLSPEDLTVTSDGVVVVLENVVNQLKRFDRNGIALGSIPLKAAWGRAPNYVAGLEADVAGGVIVYDFQGSPEFIHMRADGSVSDSYTPALADGRRFRAIGNVQPGVGGQRWTSDGSALMRVSADGKIAQVIGTAPDSGALEHVVGMHISRNGRIHAVDERSGAVHVFDANGQRQRTCRPAVDDYDEDLSLPEITVSDTGDVFVELSNSGQRPGYVHYAADCTRIGVERVGVDPISETWLAQPGGSQRWVLGYNTLSLLDGDGKVRAEQARDARGNWLIDPSIPATAADGSLVLYHGRALNDDSAEANPATSFVFFDAQAKPLRQISAPANVSRWANMSYDGKLMTFIAEVSPEQRAVHVADTASGAIWRVTEPTSKWIRAWLVQTAGSAELWVFDGERQIDRLQLPAEALKH